MRTIQYGVWDGKVYDNRSSQTITAPSDLEIKQLLQFNNGNPVLSFVSHHGFLIFDPKVNLAGVLMQYYREVRDNSCGKCTPCRSGSNIVFAALEKAAAGKAHEVDWDEIQTVLELMHDTSACGVGQTTPIPLLEVLKHFRRELTDPEGAGINGGGFYSLMTAPCIEACPAKVNVPRYIDYLRDQQYDLATGVILRHYPLVSSCGRVCVRFCEHACRRQQLEGPVDIKNLKRFAGDKLGTPMNAFFRNAYVKPSELAPKIAVIGAGPAGITCAYHLLLKGYQVEIFEGQYKAGGMALLGIPQYRLPKGILQTEIGVINSLGGRFHFNNRLGRDFGIDDLFDQGFNAVFIGVGCSKGMKLGFPEDDLEIEGYQNGLGFLLEVGKAVDSGLPPKLEGDFVIVGGGNVAMDCCRSAARLTTGKVNVVYRRTEKEAPADPAEIRGAKEEGVEFHWLTAQKELVVEDGKVVGLKCVKLKMDIPPEGGRGKLTELPGTEFIIPCTHVISAIGQRIDQSIFTEEDGILFDKRGNISVTSSLATSRPAVFAGGDCATGPTTLVGGMGHGQLAAESIDEYLSRGSVGFVARTRMSAIIQKTKLLKDFESCRPVKGTKRTPMNELDPDFRSRNFEEVELGFTEDQALQEASRCMRCYRLFAVTTQLPIPGVENRE